MYVCVCVCVCAFGKNICCEGVLQMTSVMHGVLVASLYLWVEYYHSKRVCSESNRNTAGLFLCLHASNEITQHLADVH